MTIGLVSKNVHERTNKSINYIENEIIIRKQTVFVMATGSGSCGKSLPYVVPLTS